ncbi:MAG TPA: peptidylprolyl isomerase, partial [Polyangia bacterium]|nr:peptidylprolyl isomerase [Polyangia bacterium]
MRSGRLLCVLAMGGVLASARGVSAEPIEPLPAAPPPAPPAAPADVAAPPADAKKTASGLASKVLFKGKGSAHPGPHDRVVVQYTGWTPDGK